MRGLWIVCCLFHIGGWCANYDQIDYSGAWNLSYEIDGKVITKNEILIFKTANIEPKTQASIYSVRGYLAHEEILAVYVYFDKQDNTHKIDWITLNTGDTPAGGLHQGDIDSVVFTIDENSSADILNLVNKNSFIRNARLSKKFAFLAEAHVEN